MKDEKSVQKREKGRLKTYNRKRSARSGDLCPATCVSAHIASAEQDLGYTTKQVWWSLTMIDVCS